MPTERPFPVPTDPIFYLTVLIAVPFLGLARGGFPGGGMSARPLLWRVIPPFQAIAIVLPILIVQDIISIWVYWRDWDKWNVKVLAAGAVIGIAAGWGLSAVISDAQVKLVIGVIAAVFVLSHWFLPKPKKEPGKPKALLGVFWGGVSAFTSTLSHAGGPPFAIYVLPQRMSKMRFVGTSTIFFALVNVMKLVPFFALGMYSFDNIKTSLVLIPLAIATNFLGIWLVRITPTELFYRIAYILIFLIGAALIESGVRELLFSA
mgnify:FL=1